MSAERRLDLDRAYAALFRALDCDRLGFVRDGMLQMAASALRRVGEHRLAGIVAAAVNRVGGDWRDLERALEEIGRMQRETA